MTNTWLQAALASSLAAPHPNFSPRDLDGPSALALILQARLPDYSRYTTRGERPASIEEFESHSMTGTEPRLLAGALGVLSLDEHTPAVLASMIEARDDSGTVAALLLSTYYGRVGLDSAAAQVVDDRFSLIANGALISLTEEFELALLRIHRAARSLALGRKAEAVNFVEDGRRRLFELPDRYAPALIVTPSWADERVRPTSIVDAVEAASANILMNCSPNESRDREVYRTASSAPTSEVNARRALRLVTGLRRIVEDEFTQTFSSGRTVHYRAVDSTDTAFEAAILQSEMCGDIISAHATELLQAKYQLLGSTSYGGAQNAFRILERSGDNKSLRRFCDSLVRQGPLDLLARRGEELTVERWTTLNEAKNTVLRLAASLLKQNAADDLGRRLLVQVKDARTYRTGGAPSDTELWQTIGSLTSAISDGLLNVVVLRLVRTLEQSNDALLVQRSQSVFSQVDWTRLDDKVRTSIARTATGWIERPDHEFAAATAAIELAKLGDFRLISSFAEAQLKTPSLYRLAVLIDASYELDRELRESGRALVSNRIHETIKDAQEGRYSTGTVDAGALAWRLACRYGMSELWDLIAELFCSPSVSPNDKEGIARSVALEPSELPRLYRERFVQYALGARVHAMSSFWLDDRTSVSATSLMVLLALDAVDQSDVLLRLSELVGEGDSAERSEAARLIATMRRKLNIEGVLGILLQLNRDKDVEVRASAASATAALLSQHPRNTVLNRESLRLLDVDGVSIPNRWLQGVVVGESVMPQEIESKVRALTDTHRSAIVRKRAEGVLRQL